MGQRVVVGMSGGVDSSVAAWLLREQGYEVIGVTLQNWRDSRCAGDGESCAAADARRVADVLGIPYAAVDCRAEFKRCVIDYFVEEYLRGRTPNPCVVCNPRVKWAALLKYADETGADFIATGHYANVRKLNNGRYTICSPVTARKDQTYALYGLSQEQLARTLLPLGMYAKEEIRAIAGENGIPVADKPDSQEICFVPDGDYAGYIEREAGERVPGPGDFVAADGTVLGRHKGIIHYTVGQRRGLTLPMGKRVFVTAIRPEANEVEVGENADVLASRVACGQVNYMAIPDLTGPRQVLAKIRYNHRGEYGVIEKQADGTIVCDFEKPVRAATPGQAMVFYEDGHVLGGGTIL